MFAYDKKTKYSYNFNTYEELSYICRRDGYDIPLSKDTSVLERKPTVVCGGYKTGLSNSLSIHPMEGFDANPRGGPSELTIRRWMRFAHSGAGLIWSEAISVVPEGRSNERQLTINEENADEYKALIAEMKKVTSSPIIIQLTHSGRMSKNSSTPHPLFITRNAEFESIRPQDRDVPVLGDDYLDALPEKYAAAARLAVSAGFDGVDVKMCHSYLLGESLSAFLRDGKYGGSYENRTRLARSVFDAVKAAIPGNMMIGSRFALSDMIRYPYGFGVTKDEIPAPDFTEPFEFLSELQKKGLGIVDMTMGSPYFNSYVNRPANLGTGELPEHPLTGLARLISASAALKKAVPQLCVIGTGYSYLKDLAQYAAAGAVIEGRADIVGFGRMAFAYPDFAKDFIAGKADPKKSCISCGKCTQIMRKGGTTGCPIRDQEVYLPIYKAFCMEGNK